MVRSTVTSDQAVLVIGLFRIVCPYTQRTASLLPQQREVATHAEHVSCSLISLSRLTFTACITGPCFMHFFICCVASLFCEFLASSRGAVLSLIDFFIAGISTYCASEAGSSFKYYLELKFYPTENILRYKARPVNYYLLLLLLFN
jgi:hypothetical protein